MASPKIRISGKGHSLCLRRILQSSFHEECFTDITLLSSLSSPRSFKANKSVLAAASPFLNQLLQGSSNEEETVIILCDYSFEDVAALLQYIYTGEATALSNSSNLTFKKLLEDLQIGNSPKKVKISTQSAPPAQEKKSTQNLDNFEVENDVFTINGVNYPSAPQDSGKSISHARKKRESSNVTSLVPRQKSTYSSNSKKHFRRPASAHYSDVTMKDPSLTSQESEYMRNPYFGCTSSTVEKIGTKCSFLPAADSFPSDTFYHPRLADRVGIYFDPLLERYYNGLIKSQAPLKIFLPIELDQVDQNLDNEEESQSVLYPSAVYRRNPTPHISELNVRNRAEHDSTPWLKRMSFANNRLAVKTMCFVNGKTHLTLDGEPKLNPLLQTINYPKDAQLNADEALYDEQDVDDVIEVESRRKKVLLSTLSRLKKDVSRAKRIAKDILQLSKKQGDGSDGGDGGDGETEQLFPIDTHCEPLQPVKKRAKKNLQSLVVCEICGKMISASWIRVHKANHEGEKPYLCEHCGRSFASSNLLKSHVHYQHNSNLDYFTCSVCSKAFNKKSRLDIHMRIHNEVRPFECSTCGKKFHTNGNLRKHLVTHTGDRPHKCHLCDKSFSQMTNLRLHLRIHEQLVDSGKSNVHVRKPEMIYRCDFCPMTFSRERHFYFHRCTHTGEKPSLACSHCDTRCANIHELKQHKLLEHPGTIHQCPMCEKSFFKKSAMQKHMAVHSQDSAPKPVFQCQHCSSQFTTAAAKIVHERSHTGERPFHCYFCEKSFTSKYNFRQHLRMHSDDRPYRCDSCPKAFRQPQHLRAHSFTHRLQDEPVTCPVCQKVFRNKILLSSHKRIHKIAKSAAASQSDVTVLNQETQPC